MFSARRQPWKGHHRGRYTCMPTYLNLERAATAVRMRPWTFSILTASSRTPTQHLASPTWEPCGWLLLCCGQQDRNHAAWAFLALRFCEFCLIGTGSCSRVLAACDYKDSPDSTTLTLRLSSRTRSRVGHCMDNLMKAGKLKCATYLHLAALVTVGFQKRLADCRAAQHYLQVFTC